MPCGYSRKTQGEEAPGELIRNVRCSRVGGAGQDVNGKEGRGFATTPGLGQVQAQAMPEATG